MVLTARSSLTVVAAAVGDALRRAGIEAVLTGGACASLYTGGASKSEDADFVLQSSASQKTLDQAMASLGFARTGQLYRHPQVRFTVEFPPGPLGIGEDRQIRPVVKRIGRARLTTLSATDACRDRLAAFFFWGDRQSLQTAIDIAVRNRIDLSAVRRWSLKEGSLAAYEEFVAALRVTRRRRPAFRRSPAKR